MKTLCIRSKVLIQSKIMRREEGADQLFSAERRILNLPSNEEIAFSGSPSALTSRGKTPAFRAGAVACAKRKLQRATFVLNPSVPY